MDVTMVERIKALGSNVTCPMCGETEFDAIGLKLHIVYGWCEVWEAVPFRDADLSSSKEATEA